MAGIFISHSSRDGEQAERLVAWLHAHGFTDLFLDFDKHGGIAPGADWERKLYSELSRAEAVILIVTRNWFDSKWCFVEFAQARALGKAIFPIVETPSGDTLVSPDIQHLDLVKDRDGGLDRLGAELTRIMLDARGGFAWEAGRAPYPGLLAFAEGDAAIYFGRDDDTRRLIERLNARRAQGGARLVALLGASGAGKSSLLRAGVLPRLKRDPGNWIVLPPFRPQHHPIDELATAVAAALGPAGDWRRWRTALAVDEPARALEDLTRDLRIAHGANEARILIAIDQGEELFGVADRAEAERFLRLLDAALGEHLPFLAVMTLRSDCLGLLQQASGLAAPFEEFSLKPLPAERWRDIILGPARVARLTVEDGLVSAAIKDAATGDALPLLAFALRELYDRFGAGGRLTAAAYLAFGDEAAGLSPLDNAVRRRADEVLREADPGAEDLAALKEAFIPAMVRVNTDGEYARRPARLAALPARARPLIERLTAARLLVKDGDGDQTQIEVAHEALLRKWPLLRGWLDEEREFLVGKEQLEQDLRDWQQAPPAQRDDALLSGLKLTRAQGWLAAKPRQLSDAERGFIAAGIARRDAETARRERLRRRITAGSIAVALVLALLFALSMTTVFVAENQRNNALIAQSQFLARDAQRAVDAGRPGLGARYASAALPRSLAHPDRPFVIVAEQALENAFLNPMEQLVIRHDDPVNSASFSPDGTRIVTTSLSVAYVWDAKTGTELLKLFHDNTINSASFSPHGRRILTGALDGARIWDAKTGAELVRIQTRGVNCAVFSPDGARIATASLDKSVRIWNARTGVQIAVMYHQNNAMSVAFSPDGTRLVSASFDNTVRVWDANSGKQILPPLAAGSVNSAAFSPDGARIVTSSNLIFDAKTGAEILRLWSAPYDLTAAFSPDGAKIVTAGGDGTVRIWNANTGNEIARSHHDKMVESVAFSTDGTRIISASLDGTARVWTMWEFEKVHEFWHRKPVAHTVFSPDGRRILTAAMDDTARVWDVATGTELLRLNHQLSVSSAEYSPDGMRIVTTADMDTAAHVWDARTGAELLELHHDGGVNSASFSRDGKWIVTAASDDNARIWNASTGAGVINFKHDSPVLSAAFSPDGSLVATGSLDKTARIWNATNGKQLLSIPHGGFVYSVAFSPHGKRIVTASQDFFVRVLDAKTGAEILRIRHEGQAMSASFSPDGRRIISASADRTARIWDARTGHEILRVTHDNSVLFAAFSPDGTRFATASADGSAQVWRLPPRCQALIDLAWRRLSTPLSPAERATEFLETPTTTFLTRLYASVRPVVAFALPQAAGDSCT